jgi:hypothetical protein
MTLGADQPCLIRRSNFQCAVDRIHWKHVKLALLTMLLVASTSPAWGSVLCPVPAGHSQQLAAIDGQARLAWIDSHLTSTARQARLWTWGWGIGIGAATVGNLVPLAFVSPGDRIDWYTGAATTVIGIVPLLIAPLEVIGDARALHVEVASASESQVCKVLADAENRLARDAANEAEGRRWWLHPANVLLNTGVGLFLALGYHHWAAGAFNAIGGSAIGEAIILTQPTGTIEDLRRYRSGELGQGVPTARAGLSYTQPF